MRLKDAMYRHFVMQIFHRGDRMQVGRQTNTELAAWISSQFWTATSGNNRRRVVLTKNCAFVLIEDDGEWYGTYVEGKNPWVKTPRFETALEAKAALLEFAKDARVQWQ
jgi:hypothetical protein